MTGRFHRIGNTGLCTLMILLLITVLGFGVEYLFAIPIGIYTATFPDIDQSRTVPKEWRIPKLIIKILIFLIGAAALAGIILSFNGAFKGKITKEMLSQCAIILTIYFAVYAYSKSKNGAFLTAHRGFTHTLIIPIALYLGFRVCQNMMNSAETDSMVFIWRAASVICIGFITGIVGHLILDLECLAGAPIFWPIPFLGIIMKGKDKGKARRIHIGWAKTSDEKAKDRTHISSKIYTYITVIICYVISLILIFRYFGYDIIGMFFGGK